MAQDSKSARADGSAAPASSVAMPSTTGGSGVPASASGPAGAHDARSYAALRHPASRIYLIGAALAMMADSVEHVISYWMIFEKFQSPALAGFAVIAHWVPFLLFSIWAGGLADRVDPRRLIQAGMALFMLASLGWGLLFVTDTLERWHAIVLLIVHGFAGVLWAPAGQVLIHDIVGERQLQSAIRLLATSRTLGLLLGPAVGGALLLLVGPSIGILLNVLIYLPLTLWLINNPKRVHSEAGPSARAMTSFADMFATIRQVAALPVVFAMIALSALAATFVANAYEPQVPEFVRNLGYGGQGLHYTMMLTASAAGALAAGIVLEARSLLDAKPRTAFVLAIMWAVAILGFAMSPNYLLSLVFLCCAGFLDLSFNAMTRTLAQLNAPATMRGRAIGLFNVGSLGCRTFSGITVGFGGGLIGIQWSLGLSAALLLLAMLLLYRWAERSGGLRSAVA
jgi:MFS family permease